LFLQNNAVARPRSFWIARTALRFPENSANKQRPYPLWIYDALSKGPMTQNEK
jgi:hypothetical protein